ncbi:MAG: sel1 repeat family protein [Verrucomicrobiales bacterium]|nr:sel1 repeat family protein [Verrucomicrobiales bacterium]
MMDYVKAFGWMSFAAKAGDRQAAKNLAQLRQISGDRAGDGLKRAAEIEAAIKKQGEQDASGKPATPKSK